MQASLNVQNASFFVAIENLAVQNFDQLPVEALEGGALYGLESCFHLVGLSGKAIFWFSECFVG